MKPACWRIAFEAFFAQERKKVSLFGSTVNQIFEAFVFAEVAGWYRHRQWQLEFVHPIDHDEEWPKNTLRLKFSTRGRPSGYSFARCTKGDERVEIRHQLRVATCHHQDGNEWPANICLDVAVIRGIDLTAFHSDQAVPNQYLVTFGEAKHMNAFAELIAGFIGLAYELQPTRLKRVPRWRAKVKAGDHLAPFLYVSGHLNGTGRGLALTMRQRGFDLDIYCNTAALSQAVALPVRQVVSKRRLKKTRSVAISDSSLRL